MITVKVRMLAFCNGEVRQVELPHKEPTLLRTLSEVYHYGKNDFQRRPLPSVSTGDVIELDSDLYLVCRVGFRKLTQAEYEAYVSLPRRDRHFSDLVDEYNVS